MRDKIGFGFRLLILMGFVSLLPVSCNDDQKSKIPYVHVEIGIQLANHIDLNVPGGYIYYPQHGYAGIIVFCEDVGMYSAYDAACTYDVSQNCSLLAEGAIDGVIATCPCCSSQYSLFGAGYVIKGPAAEPLKTYRTQTLNGGSRIRVYN